MAKDNLFLGMARGSVGDVTFTRLNGVQVARARNRAPRNPQTPAQMLQRIVMATAGKAYSFMQDICNHSFEGFEQGQLSQRKFMEVNVGFLRDKIASLIAYPVEELVKSSTAFNFSYKNDYLPVINRYMLSAGSLPSLSLVSLESGSVNVLSFDPGERTTATITYADMVSLLGVQRGDQLTFIQATTDNTLTGHDKSLINGFRYARVILEPSSGDMSAPFLTSGGAVNLPNERNEGAFSRLVIVNTDDQKGLSFLLPHVSEDSKNRLAGSAVILSRESGGRWLRSQQFLELRHTSSAIINTSPINEAYESYMLSSSSDLYLNQAE